MPFQPGNNANPRGRPRGGLSLAAKIRAKAGDDAAVYVDELHRMALSRRIAPKVRVEVMRLLIERGYGRAPQDINVNTSSLDLSAVDLSRASDTQIEQLHEAAATTTRIINELRGESTAVH